MKRFLVFILSVVALLGAVMSVPLSASAATSSSPPLPDYETGLYYYLTFNFANTETMRIASGSAIHKTENGGFTHKSFREFNMEMKFPKIHLKKNDDGLVLVARVMIRWKNIFHSETVLENSKPIILVTKEIYDALKDTKEKCYLTLMWNGAGATAFHQQDFVWPWESGYEAKYTLYSVPLTSSTSVSFNAAAVPMDGYYASVPDGNQAENPAFHVSQNLFDRIWAAITAVFDGTAGVLDYVIVGVAFLAVVWFVKFLKGLLT